MRAKAFVISKTLQCCAEALGRLQQMRSQGGILPWVLRPENSKARQRPVYHVKRQKGKQVRSLTQSWSGRDGSGHERWPLPQEE